LNKGTTNIVACVVKAGEPHIIRTPEGARTLPSFASVDAQGKLEVGLTAKRQASINPHGTFFGTKRFIGRKFADNSVKRDIPNFPFKIVEHLNGEAWAEAYGRRYSPAFLGGQSVRAIVDMAKSQLDTPIREAVIAVPASFNMHQRQATKDAGQQAGLNVRLISEPTAAALAYGLHRSGDRIVAVYDLGGGTFDISIVQVRSGVFEVLSTNGDAHLGGEDLDAALLRLIVQKSLRTSIRCLGLSHEALARLREAAERAKIELSSSFRTRVLLPFITKTQDLDTEITRHECDSLVTPLILRTMELVRAAMKDAKVKTADITDVCLVGGMTRIPKVKTAVKEFFGRNPIQSISPEEVVAIGAARQGQILCGHIQAVVLDKIPLSVGIETFGGVFTPVIKRNSTIPISKSITITTTEDFVTSEPINIYQGESDVAAENTLLGSFTLKGISNAQKGIPSISITFSVDAESIIQVHARDLSTGSSDGITIADWCRLSYSDTSPEQFKTLNVRRLLDTSPQDICIE
jgi:molecular chaperone DnaK